MSTIPTPKGADRKNPRSKSNAEPAAVWLRRFINENGKREWLLDKAVDVIRAIVYPGPTDNLRNGEEAGHAEAAAQFAVYQRAMLLIEQAQSHLSGRIFDRNDSIAHQFEPQIANGISRTVEMLLRDMAELERVMRGNLFATAEAMAAEAAITKALGATKPPDDALPEPIANCFKLSFELERLAQRLRRFRDAGGEGIGKAMPGGNVNDHAYMLDSIATEMRTNVLAPLIDNGEAIGKPTAEQVKLSRLLLPEAEQ